MKVLGFGKAKQKQAPEQPKAIGKDEALDELELRARKSRGLNILTRSLPGLNGFGQ